MKKAPIRRTELPRRPHGPVLITPPVTNGRSGMNDRLSKLPGIEIDRRLGSGREWIDQLRSRSVLPYRSLALMPSILPHGPAPGAQCRAGFGWTDQNFAPLAFMTEHMPLRVYRWWVANLDIVFGMFPRRKQWESHGESALLGCQMPLLRGHRVLPRSLHFPRLAPDQQRTGGHRLGFLSV